MAPHGCPEIFDTDQGSQFTSPRFTEMLTAAQGKISMDGRGRWIDNAMIERLWRPLKCECVCLNAFETGSEVRGAIGKRIAFYNTERPHSALGGRRPVKAYQGPGLKAPPRSTASLSNAAKLSGNGGPSLAALAGCFWKSIPPWRVAGCCGPSSRAGAISGSARPVWFPWRMPKTARAERLVRLKDAWPAREAGGLASWRKLTRLRRLFRQSQDVVLHPDQALRILFAPIGSAREGPSLLCRRRTASPGRPSYRTPCAGAARVVYGGALLRRPPWTSSPR